MRILLFQILIFVSCFGLSQKEKIYLFHGQGSDYRIFSKLELDQELFDTIHIEYPEMERKITLQDYAKLLVDQIDTTNSYSFIGVSFGGMIISELTKILKPQKSIVVSSAQNKNEIPGRYKFMKVLPLHKILPAFMYKVGAKIAQPIVEPDRKNEKAIFKAMLNDKEPYFFKGVTKMMIGWDSVDYNENIIHIHGSNDHTLPIKNCKVDYEIDNGSHMMMLTQAKEINELINSILIN